MDQTAIGVLEPQGLLHLLSASSGAPLGEALTVQVPERVERVVCLHDRHRWYLAVSAPVPKLPILQGDQLWGGLRLAFVNGWMYGIEKQTAGIAWRRFLDSEPLPHETAHVAPVLVQMWRQSSAEGSATIGQGILRVLDTRTGREILTYRDPGMQCYSALLPSENFEKLDVHTERETFRLIYKSEEQHERASEKN
jgi:hypothetical protein